MLNKIQTSDIVEVLKSSEIFSKNKDNIYSILEYMMIYFYNKEKEVINLKEDKYINTINILQNSINSIKLNANFDMTIDNMLINLWKELK